MSNESGPAKKDDIAEFIRETNARSGSVRKPLIFDVADISAAQHRRRVDNRIRIILQTFEKMRTVFSRAEKLTKPREQFIADETTRLKTHHLARVEEQKIEIQKEINAEEGRRKSLSDRLPEYQALVKELDETISRLKVRLVAISEPLDETKVATIAESNYQTALDPNGSFAKMEISLPLLREVTERYFFDSDVYKLRHEIHCSDDIKKAAILLKWISRLRPVIMPNVERLSRKQLFANEYLAMFCLCGFLRIEPDQISDEVRLELLYTLRVHSPDEHVLIPIVRGIMIASSNAEEY